MQVAVARVEHVGDAQAVLGRQVRHARQHVGQAVARNGAVHGQVVGRDAPDRRERRHAALPELLALVLACADAQEGGAHALADVCNALDQMVDLGLRPVQFDDQ